MSLESKSQALKEILSNYDASWLLGDLSFLISAGKEKANDQLEMLSSPMRQLYYLAGLCVSSDPTEENAIQYNYEKWEQIVSLLNQIEIDYYNIFIPETQKDLTEEWERIVSVAMPSFLNYFNQGPLNYEEQVINWIRDLFIPMNRIVEDSTGLTTEDFIMFYESLDKLHNNNFQSHTVKPENLRKDWEKYTKIKMGVYEEAPDFIKEMGERDKHMFTFMTDKGIVNRFYAEELSNKDLSTEKVKIILNLLSISRGKTDFLYYTSTKPGNPLYEKPILYLGDGMYQFFEVKQVIHAIENLLESVCSSGKVNTTKYVKAKGDLLEARVRKLFSKLFKTDFKVFTGYYIDGCEQDILILWKEFAFIIEAKGYNIGEPFRDPQKAYVRIQRDFNQSIGYGYTQTRRVERKFIDQVPLRITDKNGKLIEEIDTKQYKQDFSIIVNLKTFGQVQCDLSTFIELENEDDVYPWVVKLDDLETFILTLIAQKKSATQLVNFLLMRETLHGKLICPDELQICGAFLTNKFKKHQIDKSDKIITTPDLGHIFDEQYRKTMGFENEKYLKEKQSGNTIFW